MSDVVPFEPRPIGPPGATPPNRPSVPEGYPEVRNEGLSFRDYIAVFRRQIWIILGSLAVFAGAASYIVLTAPPAYRAEAVVRLMDTRRQMTGGGSLVAFHVGGGRPEAFALLNRLGLIGISNNLGDENGRAHV